MSQRIPPTTFRRRATAAALDNPGFGQYGSPVMAIPILRLFCPLLLAASAAAQTPAPDAAPAPKAPASQPQAPQEDPRKALKQISEFEYEMGKLKLNKKERTLRIPALVNMSKGALEYLLVNERGSAHEALFITTVGAFEINVGLLLLDFQPAEYFKPDTPGGFPKLVRNPKVEANGQFDCFVEWTDKDGKMQSIRAERWVSNLKEKALVTDGPFVFNGSWVTAEGEFVAQQSGNIISLFLDSAALANNPRPDQELDDIWAVAKDVPEKGTPVTLIFQPAAAAGASKAEAEPAKKPKTKKR